MKKLLMIALAISLMGCVNQRSVARWIEKNGGVVTVDSVHVVDTVQFITERVEVDTAFSIYRTDTMIINKENLTVKTYFRNDSIFVFGECESDTVFVVRDQWVGNQLSIEKQPTAIDWFKNNLLTILTFAAIVFILIRRK